MKTPKFLIKYVENEKEDWFKRLDNSFALLKQDYKDLGKKTMSLYNTRKYFRDPKKGNSDLNVNNSLRNKSTNLQNNIYDLNYMKRMNIHNYKAIKDELFKKDNDKDITEKNILNNILSRLEKKNFAIQDYNTKTKYFTNYNSVENFNTSEENTTGYNNNNYIFNVKSINGLEPKSERTYLKMKCQFPPCNNNKNFQNTLSNSSLLKIFTSVGKNQQNKIRLFRNKIPHDIYFHKINNKNDYFDNILKSIDNEEKNTLINSKALISNITNYNEFFLKTKNKRENRQQEDFILLGNKKITQSSSVTRPSFFHGCKNLRDLNNRLKDENKVLRRLRFNLNKIYVKKKDNEFIKNNPTLTKNNYSKTEPNI